MKYITVLDGVETPITKDTQMFDCIEAGGEIYSIDDSGSRVLIANGEHGFIAGRPAFPVYPEHYKPPQEDADEYVTAAKILLGMEV